MEHNSKLVFIYTLPALLTPVSLIPFTTEEITGCINEAAKDASKTPRNLPPHFSILCFTVSVTPSINTPKSSHDFMILIISFKFSFKKNKVNPALASPFPLILL